MRFVPNRACESQLERTAEMVATMQVRAEDAADECRAIAPVGHTGNYKDSIEGVAGLSGGKAKGRVVASDFKAGWLEFGTYKMQAFATLRRGVEAAGFGVKSSR